MYCKARIWDIHDLNKPCNNPIEHNSLYCKLHSKVINKYCKKCDIIHEYNMHIFKSALPLDEKKIDIQANQ